MQLKPLLLFSICLASAIADAQEGYVAVSEVASIGGTDHLRSSIDIPIGGYYTSENAATIEGFSFVGWRQNESDAVLRDEWGKALDRVKIKIDSASECLLIAEYLPLTQDEDADSLPDGTELYWFGSLEYSPLSDPDGDGITIADEIASGMSPLFPEDACDGGIAAAEGQNVEYNPNHEPSCTIRSYPDESLLGVTEKAMAAGTFFILPHVDCLGTSFACWIVNGIELRDEWGVAIADAELRVPSTGLDIVAKTIDDEDERLSYYWYGQTDVSPDSDTDGDGFSLADEVLFGTNPITPDEFVDGCVVYAAGEPTSVNLCAYEQQTKGVLDGVCDELYYSPLGDNHSECKNWGNDCPITPYAVDVNGDGLWDLVLVAGGVTNVYENVGTQESPAFKTSSADDFVVSLPPLNDVAFPKDGIPEVIAQTIEALALDWDDDGDTDYLCGTADGRLILLINPRAGRPTGLMAKAGVGNVLLEWNVVQNPSVYGYGLYRNGAYIGQSSLPSYRDMGLAPGAYNYSVSTITRRYRIGSSLPVIRETGKTNPVQAYVGKIALMLRDVVVSGDGECLVSFTIDNSYGAEVRHFTCYVDYDDSLLSLQSIKTSEIVDAANLEVEPIEAEAGLIKISFTADKLIAGEGNFMDLRFLAKSSVTTNTSVAVESAMAQDANNQDVPIVISKDCAEISIIVDDMPIYMLGDLDGDGDVDVEDLRLLAKLKSAAGRRYTANQLKAGDFNGNGKLDDADYQALRKLLKDNRKL